MPLSKPFVIATEGPTIDGRTISRQWITDMAKNYSQKVYTAVANLEHYLSSLPDGIFKAYGKIVSLSTQEAEILGEKKMQLLAVVDASPDIVALQKKGQKAFASMEVGQIGSGSFYLTGLAFTDKPASLGTETMKFSFCGAPGERYAFKEEVAIEFEAEEKPSDGESFAAKIKAMLFGQKKNQDEQFADLRTAVEAIAESQKALLDRFAAQDKATAEFVAGELKESDFTKRLDDLTKNFADLEKKLATTDGDDKGRPPAAGGDGSIKTDC